MERSQCGREGKVRRARFCSIDYRDYCPQALGIRFSDAPRSRSPCKKNTRVVDFTEVVVLTTSEPPLGVAKRNEPLIENVEVESEVVIWSDDPPALKYSSTLCEECGRGDAAAEMLLCDGCDRGFHMFCLCPILVTIPMGDWFCPHCSQSSIAYEFPKVQKRVVDYFRVQKLLPSNPVIEGMETRKWRSQSGGSTCPQKKSRRLLPYVPSTDLRRRLEQMASLATALTSIGVEFSDSLSYGLAPRTANRAANEKGGMREMAKDDKAALDLCKAMCRRGQWQPLMVTHDLRQGFVVEADDDIQDMTVIAEYTGEVDYMCCRQYDSGNSIMGLLFSDDPVKELVICPDRRGNIARFVSGINNHSEEGRKKQNVRCVRYSINGEARAILIAMRDILKGERLYYDYNAYCTEYPTQHFV